VTKFRVTDESRLHAMNFSNFADFGRAVEEVAVERVRFRKKSMLTTLFKPTSVQSFRSLVGR
jgi:hypothetical protein